jgi:hypothetical protein
MSTEGLAGPGGLAGAGGSAGAGGLASTGELAGEEVTSAEPYEYALIRVVPRVERGEAMNAGVILYCQQHRYLGCRILLDEDRLRVLDPGTDLAAVAAALGALEEGCRSGPAAAGSRRGCGSAGSPPRAARSCSPARCTAG